MRRGALIGLIVLGLLSCEGPPRPTFFVGACVSFKPSHSDSVVERWERPTEIVPPKIYPFRIADIGVRSYRVQLWLPSRRNWVDFGTWAFTATDDMLEIVLCPSGSE